MTVFTDPVLLPARPLRGLLHRLAGAARGLARLLAAVEMPRLRPGRPAAPLAARLSEHLLRDLGMTRDEYDGL